MHRLVVATTTLLALVGVVVVAGYLLIFAAQSDRLARAVPSTASLYATVYLQPSTGQKLNIGSLLGRVPGFADPSSLDQKIHEITGRLLGQAGLDYEGDIRPWLGDQVAFAVEPSGLDPQAAQVLVVVEVKDPAIAADALKRMADGLGLSWRSETYQGAAVSVAGDTSWALREDILLVGSSAEVVRAGLDADADRSASLADSARFRRAMESLPPDHLGSIYVDLAGTARAAGVGEELGGYTAAGLALVVEPDGLRLAGSAPFDADAASAPQREAFALSSEPSSLADWMPAGTQLEAVVFGLSQTLRAAEAQLGAQDATGEIAAAITQLRALAALGLGINVDEDILPLFDREAAVALTGLDGGQPSGQLLLRPSDAAAADASLERMRDALVQRGADIQAAEHDGTTIAVLRVPDLGAFAYAMRDGVIVFGLDAAAVIGSLDANSTGSSLAEDARYRGVWDLAGERGGNEIWVDAASVLGTAADAMGLEGDARDILLQVEALGMTAPARDEHSEFHLALTMR